MQSIFKTLIIASTIALALPSFAHADARVFTNTITAPLTTPVKIEIVLSKEMQHRANNLPTKLIDRNRSSSRGLNNAFSSNGYYGEKALDQLVSALEKTMTQKFTKKGIVISDDAPATMRITIERAKNNRPTPTQLRKDINLSFQSFGIGGAELSAELIDQDGNSLGKIHHEYYETDIRQNQQVASIWFDAKRSFNRFANKAAKILAN